MMRQRANVNVVAVMCLMTVVGIAAAQDAEEDLRVLYGERGSWVQYTDARNAPYQLFREKAFRFLKDRAEHIGSLQNRGQWEDRQSNLRAIFSEVVGSFPQKTPLAARILGTVEREGLRVEKLIYESVPGYFVTAALFLPKPLDSPAPAILFCSGHAAEGFRSAVYQTMILNLVHKGFVVLAFDPVGQGERKNYPDGCGGQNSCGPTHEHSYPGFQGFLLGGSPARQFIWDGIRGIDYLLTRKEVDPTRIGVGGRSGGGTQSSYIAAFDERVFASAPEAYITSNHRLLSSVGPQDSEQIFFHGIARGLDAADLLAVRAPKPSLIIATTRDMFNITGTRETFSELQRTYESFGKAAAIQMVEDDAPHASTKRNRESMYAFFQEQLNLPGDSRDIEVELFSEEELQVTPSGQVKTSFGGETLFSLNRTRAESLLERLERQRENPTAHLPVAVLAARSLSGFRDPEMVEDAVFVGRYRRSGYFVEKYFLPGDGLDVVPFLLMVPEEKIKRPLVLYLHPRGKASEASRGGEIEQLVRAGYVVAAPDLLGIGETGAGDFKGDAHFPSSTAPEGVSGNLWHLGILVGESLVGRQARDVVRLVSSLNRHPGVDASSIAAISYGTLGSVLLHAAAFDKRLERLALMKPFSSFAAVVYEHDYETKFIPALVAGALTAYDLPDLAASLAPRELWVAGMTDAKSKLLSHNQIQEQWGSVISAHEARGTLTLLDEPDVAKFLHWLQK